MKNPTVDPRVRPVARLLCKFMEDDWKLGKQPYTKAAKEFLAAADANDPLRVNKEKG